VATPDRAVIAIMSNDDANGVIEFSDDSLFVTMAEPASNEAERDHSFKVVRSVGVFGNVGVMWEVVGATTQQV